MKAVWRQLRIILGLVVFVYVIAMPVIMGGFDYGARRTPQTAWPAAMHLNHGSPLAVMRQGLGSMGRGALLSGLAQLGVLILIVLLGAWLFAALDGRRGREPS
jgi:hypothetical protein